MTTIQQHEIGGGELALYTSGLDLLTDKPQDLGRLKNMFIATWGVDRAFIVMEHLTELGYAKKTTNQLHLAGSPRGFKIFYEKA